MDFKLKATLSGLAVAAASVSTAFAQQNDAQGCTTPLIGGAFHVAAATEGIGYPLANAIGGDVQQLIERNFVPSLFETLLETNPYFASLPTDLGAREAIREAGIEMHALFVSAREDNIKTLTPELLENAFDVMRRAMEARAVDPSVIEDVMALAQNRTYDMDHLRDPATNERIMAFSAGRIECPTPFNIIP